MKHLLYFLSACGLFAFLPCTGQRVAQRIWFDRPNGFTGLAAWQTAAATSGVPVDAGSGMQNAEPEWERRSLPIGNGSIGANVMGSVTTERLTLNEKTLWRGGPGTGRGAEKGTPAGAVRYWDMNKMSASALPEIRKSLLKGDYEKAGRLTAESFCGTVPYEATGEPEFRFGSFTTLGELRIETGIDSTRITGYSRALSLDSAVTTVRFGYNGDEYTRQAFVSYPDNVLVIRFKASRGGLQHLRVRYLPNPLSEGRWEADGAQGLCYAGVLDNNGMRFVVRLRVLTRGGSVDNADGLSVEEADEVTLLLTADTDYAPNYDPDFSDPKAYVGVDPVATTARWMTRAAKKGFGRLLCDHYKDYSNLFGRVEFSLNDSGADDRPTDRRLADYRKGQADPALETLYYQFGRYLLIASSRPGNLPANLQGIWHNNVDGPWRVDYHNNINLQMNYWPALSANLAECAKPLTDFIRLLEMPGRVTARDYWGARGWAAGISANPFGFTAPLEGRDMSWNYNPMAASWLVMHLWDYYDYTRDVRFLRQTAYPLIKGCAEFTQDFLWLHPDGYYTAAPSTSPEHGPVDMGTTFVHAVARDVLAAAVHASAVLGEDSVERRKWQNVLDSIAPYRVGRYGQLLEWSRDIDDPEDHHRHVNHLYGLHPGNSITPLATPDLARAARVVLEHRGDGATGWSMGWKLNQWARLHDGNHSYLLYGNLLKNGTADNLWDMHPPFQIDGNLGGTAGVTEMLLQSHAGFIELLPALPDAWRGGSITGLRARGNFNVDIFWADGRLARAVITSESGEKCVVRYGGSVLKFPTKRGKRYVVVMSVDGLALE